MIYVVIQFSCIIYLIFNIQPNQLDWLEYFLLSMAVIIGSIAVINMKFNNLNIIPTLKDNHQLRTHGIYKFIRHPMYTSVLLSCLALVLSNPHWIAQLVMTVLLINLILKSNFEEKLLLKRFKGYSKYRQKTGRFLPFKGY
ncbi:MAG TPA: isoprenylcysteine carboxylmethyltransferase family protein [Candidatus Thioglobus sp.]|jgi:protein-S-isoprenylcysteine O-methyltransferase Ste14|nr:isoprenylcysteine carboxylmethyltransferase family protein [Candidatus Thioglobus sp.]